MTPAVCLRRSEVAQCGFAHTALNFYEVNKLRHVIRDYKFPEVSAHRKVGEHKCGQVETMTIKAPLTA